MSFKRCNGLRGICSLTTTVRMTRLHWSICFSSSEQISTISQDLFSPPSQWSRVVSVRNLPQDLILTTVQLINRGEVSRDESVQFQRHISNTNFACCFANWLVSKLGYDSLRTIDSVTPVDLWTKIYVIYQLFSSFFLIGKRTGLTTRIGITTKKMIEIIFCLCSHASMNPYENQSMASEVDLTGLLKDPEFPELNL